MPSVSVLIPVYKSEKNLPELYKRLKAVLQHNADAFEMIFVEDGSGDGSWRIIEEIAASDKNVRGIQLNRNFGHHNALFCGLHYVRYEAVVTLDDDLQHPPEEIPKLLAKLLEGSDVVYGTAARAVHGLWKNMATAMTKFALSKAMGIKNAQGVSAFRCFRAGLREAFLSFQGPFVSIDVLLAWSTNRFAFVATKHDKRALGRSHYTFSKLLAHALNMITGFSTWPLRFASIVGFIFTLFGVAVLFYVLGRFLILGYSVPGFPFLASTIAIFSGVQLFTIGIIGEYLARVHYQGMGKPAYVVRQRLNVE